MPHSNDRIVVSAAGDSEVRIFDIEYSGQTGSTSTSSAIASAGRRRGFNNVYKGVRYLSDGDTNAKVFRSHNDRVKRIVTESSPHLFLTCSEDGDVRQWDVRQPSTAYPAPSMFGRGLRPSTARNTQPVPPPLISYSRYNLDLNTISCSPNQPHYIALGGAHLHCFLHDRRMLGRDLLSERGMSLPSPRHWSENDEEQFAQATRCVRKFAPKGKQTMLREDTGHITACKISDANPNEIVVSWSGDWIYSFDLARDPNVTNTEATPTNTRATYSKASRVEKDKSRKRKRVLKESSTLSGDGPERVNSRPRTESPTTGDDASQMSLMVQYENGQSEQIPIQVPGSRAETQPFSLSKSERTGWRIARITTRVRRAMFVLVQKSELSTTDPTGFLPSFNSVLASAAVILPEMDIVMRKWRYPINPSPHEVIIQKNFRQRRAASRRFVQAAGTLARVLGGQLERGESDDRMIEQYFTRIEPVINERNTISRQEQFSYDFLKAILLWLDSGIGALLEGFSAGEHTPRDSPRFPLPQDSDEEAIDEILIPYLLQLASTDPVVNVDSSPFEVDENRRTFGSEKAAVLAFAQAIKIPFADLSSAVVRTSSEDDASTHISAQDRQAALRFWALKVGRGLLLPAGKELTTETVDRAFGGNGRSDSSTRKMDQDLKFKLEEIDPREEGLLVSEATITTHQWAGETAPDQEDNQESHRSAILQQLNLEAIAGLPADIRATSTEPSEGLQENENEDDDEDDDDNDLSQPEYDDNDGDEHEEDEDEDDDDDAPQILFRGSLGGGSARQKVGKNVPCLPDIRHYRGHCNLKTVKDVNFYGLQDEYVVSGSDCGHLFIWDRKTMKLLNVLEGDGEVVNVVQGHPYEPVIAVSGIDHTVKIFSPDGVARWNAQNGIGVSAADASTFSSIEFGRRRRSRRSNTDAASEPLLSKDRYDTPRDSEEEDMVKPTGLPSKKKLKEKDAITSQNEQDMRVGNHGNSYITRDVLNQIVMALRARMEENGGDMDEDEDGQDHVLPVGDCRVSLRPCGLSQCDQTNESRHHKSISVKLAVYSAILQFIEDSRLVQLLHWR
jgi:DDB1- and CUL4-associated factor 6